MSGSSQQPVSFCREDTWIKPQWSKNTQTALCCLWLLTWCNSWCCQIKTNFMLTIKLIFIVFLAESFIISWAAERSKKCRIWQEISGRTKSSFPPSLLGLDVMETLTESTAVLITEAHNAAGSIAHFQDWNMFETLEDFLRSSPGHWSKLLGLSGQFPIECPKTL